MPKACTVCKGHEHMKHRMSISAWAHSSHGYNTQTHATRTSVAIVAHQGSNKAWLEGSFVKDGGTALWFGACREFDPPGENGVGETARRR